MCYSPILSDHHLIELTPPNIRLKGEWWSYQRTKTLGIGLDPSRWRHDHRPNGQFSVATLLIAHLLVWVAVHTPRLSSFAMIFPPLSTL
ncbi:hypothetical protein N7501_005158 [Penicillium viridicatum]|nr:hypothetical protein N7501_005158 [Penicillium viridicatum]